MATAIISNQQCACLLPQAGWYEYDSPLEHHQRGSGLRYCGIAKKPADPFAYFLLYALYLR